MVVASDDVFVNEPSNNCVDNILQVLTRLSISVPIFNWIGMVYDGYLRSGHRLREYPLVINLPVSRRIAVSCCLLDPTVGSIRHKISEI